MNHILREIKLSKLTDTSMSSEASKFIKFWNNLWCDMKVIDDINKGEIKCWKDGYDYYYFRQDGKHSYLWCDCDKVWTFFRDDLCLNQIEIKEFIQQIMVETLNCVVNTPMCNLSIRRL